MSWFRLRHRVGRFGAWRGKMHDVIAKTAKLIVSVDPDGLAHCLTGPAATCRGHKLYAIHGHRVFVDETRDIPTQLIELATKRAFGPREDPFTMPTLLMDELICATASKDQTRINAAIAAIAAARLREAVARVK